MIHKKLKTKIIEQEMNKMAIHTHVIFIPLFIKYLIGNDDVVVILYG